MYKGSQETVLQQQSQGQSSTAKAIIWHGHKFSLKGGLLSWLRHQKGLVLQYQLHNRVENLADVLTRCSGLLQGEDKLVRALIIFIA